MAKAPKGWEGTGDADETACDECGCYGSHNPTCSHEIAPILYVGAEYWQKRDEAQHPGRYEKA